MQAKIITNDRSTFKYVETLLAILAKDANFINEMLPSVAAFEQALKMKHFSDDFMERNFPITCHNIQEHNVPLTLVFDCTKNNTNDLNQVFKNFENYYKKFK